MTTVGKSLRRQVATALLGLSCLALASCNRQRQAATREAQDSAWVARSGIYEVFVQDFSPEGNLRGVIAGLDRIEGAGANVVWLMPIHPYGVARAKPPLGSPYAVRDYRAINPDFGIGADFRALVDAVHSRGMKIILDWVPDHTAWDHAWITQHPEYYVKNERGEISHPRDAQGNLTDWTDVAQLDYRNPDLRRVMIAEMKYWLEEYGIDGYRMDVAGFVPMDFWREAIPQLRAVTWPIMLLAEWGDLELHRAGFDFTYGWDGHNRLLAVWAGGPASAFMTGELADIQAMPHGGMRLRFNTNHDETGWNRPPVVRFTSPAGARAAFVTMALLPGRPMLYNGQEVESPQQLHLFSRMAIEWNQPRADEARAFYSKVMSLARTRPEFLGRELATVTTTAPNDVIAYRRGRTMVLVNARNREVSFTVTGADLAGARDLLSNRTMAGGQQTLAPFGMLVLEPAAGR